MEFIDVPENHIQVILQQALIAINIRYHRYGATSTQSLPSILMQQDHISIQVTSILIWQTWQPYLLIRLHRYQACHIIISLDSSISNISNATMIYRKPNTIINTNKIGCIKYQFIFNFVYVLCYIVLYCFINISITSSFH